MTASQLAELTALARLEEGDDDARRPLDRIVWRAPELVPGCAAAALTVSAPDGDETAALSWAPLLDGVRRLHSGHVGDYVAWLFVGVADLAALVGLPLA